MALLIIAVAVIASGGGACDEGPSSGDAAVGAVHAAGDIESALGEVTLMTYEQAAASKEKGKEEEEDEQCAICLSEYAEAGELVRVLPACGHFFHAECGVDASGPDLVYKSWSCLACWHWPTSMDPDVAFHLEIAAVVAVAVFIVAVASRSACEGAEDVVATLRGAPRTWRAPSVT
ncbi:hypothetical protein ACQ4PT_015017 [Festuca glaucescens]